MTSAINPNNIDGAYPVAGQDNDSQGFRDNFTNTRTNFQYAAAEITDLQNKAVLKSALTGTTLNNDMGGSILSNAQLQDISETRVALGTVSGEQTINYAAGPYYTLATSGSVNLLFTNFPAAGATASVKVQITISNVAHTLTLPAAVGSGLASTSTQYIQGWSSNVITFSATGTYVFEFTTSDGGTTIFIQDLTRTNSINQLSELSDVLISSTPANNDVLTYSTAGNVWINAPVTANLSLDDLNNVAITSPAEADFLVYDAANSEWVNRSNEVIYPLTTYTVTVADNGSATQEVFFFNGSALETNTGVQFPIEFLVNQRYRFDLSNVSNADAPLRFSTTPDTIVEPGNVAPSTVTPYNTNVTVVGTAGTAGAYVEILITEDTPSPLYFFGVEVNPAIDTSLIGAARPISVGQVNYCLGFDTIAANGAISLQTSTTVITTSSNLVATVAAGSACQTKTLVYGNTATGNALVAFSNAGWGGSGVANLSAVGSAATFQYVNNKWYCTGNNGVTFV